MDIVDMTPFALSVYEATLLIPKGRVSTYKLIADAIGKPKSVRAVGMALSKNPFAPIVPCHRVIASNGTIGGFKGTKDLSSRRIKRKIKLLEKEGIIIDNYQLSQSSTYRKKVIFTFGN